MSTPCCRRRRGLLPEGTLPQVFLHQLFVRTRRCFRWWCRAGSAASSAMASGMRASVTAPFFAERRGLAAEDVHDAPVTTPSVMTGIYKGSQASCRTRGRPLKTRLEVGAVTISILLMNTKDGSPASRTAFQMRRVRGHTRAVDGIDDGTAASAPYQQVEVTGKVGVTGTSMRGNVLVPEESGGDRAGWSRAALRFLPVRNQEWWSCLLQWLPDG